MTNSFIAIRGNHLDKTGQIFETLKYLDTHQDKQFTDWQEFNDYLLENYFEFTNKEIAIRGVWSDNSWTIISDPEMVDTVEEKALLELARKLNTEIVTFIIQSTSNSFGFTVYKGTIKRNYLVSDGEITNNLYAPLPEENGLNINENIFIDDINGLARNFGIDLEGKSNRTYLVKHFAYSDEMKRELEQFEQQHNQYSDEKRPWWKFW